METAAALYANFHGTWIETFRRREFCKIVHIKLSRIKAPSHVHFAHNDNSAMRTR